MSQQFWSRIKNCWINEELHLIHMADGIECVLDSDGEKGG